MFSYKRTKTQKNEKVNRVKSRGEKGEREREKERSSDFPTFNTTAGDALHSELHLSLGTKSLGISFKRRSKPYSSHAHQDFQFC